MEVKMNIRAENISKSFGEIKLFENLSIDIPSKKITCIFGKSGCGKTTLLNILGSIESYQNGEIYYDGIEITKRNQSSYLSKEFGFIFQNFGLLENETVYENFMIIKRLKKMRKSVRDERIKTCLKEVDLAGFENKKVFTLSGGEQQRVAIAKILVKDCRVVFADEPTASLDSENKEIIIKLLKKLKENGKTIIIVSHDHEIKRMSDVVVVLGDDSG